MRKSDMGTYPMYNDNLLVILTRSHRRKKPGRKETLISMNSYPIAHVVKHSLVSDIKSAIPPEGENYVILEKYHVKVFFTFVKQFLTLLFTIFRLRSLVWSKEGFLFFAPTGTAKSTLIKEKLGKIADEQQKKILLISPRSALDIQYKRGIAELYDPKILDKYTDAGLLEVHEIGPFDIFTMQSFQNPQARAKIRSKKTDYIAIVFDEVHEFVSDADFNPYTQMILRFLTLDIGSKCSRFYLSASPEIVIPELVQIEEHLGRNRGPLHHFEKRGLFRVPVPETWLTVFRMASDFSNVNVFFFKKDDEIPAIIKHTRTNEKSIVFITNKEAGVKIRNKLSQIAEAVSVDFINADNKSSEMASCFQEISKLNHFPSQVLISTKLLDAGVNIIDPKLKNIIICSPYPDDIVQMLGRKRVTKGEGKTEDCQIKLFLKIPTAGKIINKIGVLREKRDEMIEFCKRAKSQWSDYADVPMPFYLEQKGTDIVPRFNEYSFSLITYRIEQLEKILGQDEAETEHRFIQTIKDTLPGAKLDLSLFQNQRIPCEEVKGLVEPVIGTELDKTRITELGDLILDRLGKPRRKDQTGVPTKSLNSAFEECHLPYLVHDLSREGKLQTWVFERSAK